MILTEYDEQAYIDAERELAKKEGRKEGRAESIIEFLCDYGTPSEELCNKIYAEENQEVLKRWLKLAARVESLEQFRNEM